MNLTAILNKFSRDYTTQLGVTYQPVEKNSEGYTTDLQALERISKKLHARFYPGEPEPHDQDLVNCYLAFCISMASGPYVIPCLAALIGDDRIDAFQTAIKERTNE
jgi:hypothetical protein